MTNKEILKKQIYYRSSHRGSKEMDILLGSFVKNHIRDLNNEDLNDLERLLNFEDEILQIWYFDKRDSKAIPNNRVSSMLKDFKL